ncbi:MAG: hypothetical protein H6934_03650 [Burkholderiaceae bacterium]|nr:hypothetical protein [Burkholderiaceae bacterium]
MGASIRLLCSRVLYRVGLPAVAACLAFGTPVHATDIPIQGGPGGGYFRSLCSGDYVVGLYLRSGAWVDAVGLKCGSFIPSEGRFRQPPWNKPYHGGGGGSPQVGICPGERYLSAIRVDFTREGAKAKFLDFIEMTCSAVTVGDTMTLCLQTGNGCWHHHPNPPPGPMASFMTNWGTQRCPPGQAAIGIHGRAGKFVDAIGLICGPRPVKTQAPAATAPKSKPRPLGKVLFTTAAKNDVDVYDGPGGRFHVIGMMRKGVRATILQFHQDGWCKLRAVAAGRDGWVARDHLTRCP